MENILISVIIPTFKRKKDLVGRAIDSVLQQTYQKFEIIVVDDSPTDYYGSRLIKEYLLDLNDIRIKYIRHPENRGANAARNTGINAAKGEYIAFLDDDDEWLPYKLQLQIKKFDEPRIGMVYSPYYINRNNKKYLRESLLESGNLFIELLYSNFIGSTSCIMISKKCIKDVGMFDENLPASQDYDLYLRVSKKYLINFADEPLMQYYVHEGERITGNTIKKLEARVYIYEKYKSTIKEYPKINSKKNIELALNYAQLGNNRLKWKYWFKAFKVYPVPSKGIFKSLFKILLKY